MSRPDDERYAAYEQHFREHVMPNLASSEVFTTLYSEKEPEVRQATEIVEAS